MKFLSHCHVSRDPNCFHIWFESKDVEEEPLGVATKRMTPANAKKPKVLFSRRPSTEPPGNAAYYIEVLSPGGEPQACRFVQAHG